MKIDFSSVGETVIPNFKGGEKETAACMFFDGVNRIMRGRLIPGASIGMHSHTDSSEIIYILSGTATVTTDDGVETVGAGECHYCPRGHSHSMKNNGADELTFFAVVPMQ